MQYSIKIVGIPLLLLISACNSLSRADLSDGQNKQYNEVVSNCNLGAPHPNAPEQFEQFSFLIGDFSITSHAWLGTMWSPPRPGPLARWNGKYGLEGTTIIDEWFDPYPQIDAQGFRGINVRYFDEKSDEWKMMWVDSSRAQVQDLRAKLIDDVLTMWQVYPLRPNFKAEFIVVDKDHWHRLHYVKDDTGQWVLKFKLAATRIPCES